MLGVYDYTVVLTYVSLMVSIGGMKCITWTEKVIG